MSYNALGVTDEYVKAIEKAGWAYRGVDCTTAYLHLPMDGFPGASIPTYEMKVDAKHFEKDLRTQTAAFSAEKYAVHYFNIRGQKGLEAGLSEGKYMEKKLRDLISEFDKLKNVSKDKKKFEDRCYEMYKLHWMLNHGVTLSDYLDGIAKSADEVEMDENPKKRTPREQLIYDAEDYFVYETGFENGSCYVCKKEFLGAEFLDKEYMHSLFNLVDSGSALKTFYDEHYVEEEKPEEGEKEFYVSMRVEGRYIPKVYAKTEEDARRIATEMYSEADFGELEDIEGDCICVEDENGDFVWGK